MTPKEFQQFHESMCSTARELSARKSHDYARPDGSPDSAMQIFKNFLMCEAAGVCTVEAGFMTRLLDKVVRLGNLLSPGHEVAVKDESVMDTALDILNYTILLMAYRQVKQQLVAASATVERD